MDRLTRNVKDMTNSIELLGMQWKQGPHYCCGTYAEYKAEDALRSSARVDDGFWRVVEDVEAVGSWLDSRGCSEDSRWHRISEGNF